MKLSKETVEILKNFSAQNMSVLLLPGQVQRTISPTKTLMCKANITEDLPSEAGVNDLSGFLALYSLFDDPDIAFGEKCFTFSDSKNRKAKYYYAAKEAIIYPEKIPVFPQVDVSFNLDHDVLKEAVDAANTLKVPDLAVVGSEGLLSIRAADNRNSTSNDWVVEVGKTDLTFNIIIRMDNIKFMAKDYVVDISKKRIARFTSTDKVLEYLVSVETNSTFS